MKSTRFLSPLCRCGLPHWLARPLCVFLALLLFLPSSALGAEDGDFFFERQGVGAWVTGYRGSGGAVVIPERLGGLPVTSIEDDAFGGNTSLTSVTIPNSVTSIKWSAFSGCTSLTKIVIPNSVTSIEQATFRDCSSLASVSIPNGVNEIHGDSFSGCVSLTNITVPKSVTAIWAGSFTGCASLKALYFESNAPVIPTAYTPAWLAFDKINAMVYYLPETTGWRKEYGRLPTTIWKPSVVENDGSLGVRNNRIEFTIRWASERVVVVEACPGLTNPIWSPVGTNTLTGGVSDFSDPEWTNHGARFYRLRSP
jgi:BspA type Leucine rich repeat region (6 copies)